MVFYVVILIIIKVRRCYFKSLESKTELLWMLSKFWKWNR